MPNTLNLFYKYLSDKIVNFFNERQVKSGERFQVQFEKQEQVSLLYKELGLCETASLFTYSAYSTEYKTYYILVNGVRLIVAATIDNVKGDFLTRLRNLVGTEDEQFADTAILFIHDTVLDSIIRGTESLQKKGMPLNIDTVVNDINRLTDKSNLSLADQLIIKFSLENRNEEVHDDHTSIFDYAELLESLNSGKITEEQYKNFNLFYDPQLSEYGKSEINERLKDNYTLFAEVDTIHKYGNPDLDLEKHFDEKGVDRLKDLKWRNSVYKDVKISFDNKRNATPIEYLESSKKSTSEGLNFWERAEGESKARNRVRNILVFNPCKNEDINLEFAFNQKLSKQNLSTENGVALTSGKKLKITLKHSKGNTNFAKLTYREDNVKFEFRIAVVELNESFFENIKSLYSIFIRKNDRLILVNSDEDCIILNPKEEEQVEEKITQIVQDVELTHIDQCLILKKQVDISEEDTDYLKVTLKYPGGILPLGFKEELEKPVVITGLTVWKLKRENKESFKYVDNNKMLQGTNEYFAREEFKLNLEKELKIIESKELFFTEDSLGIMTPVPLPIDDELRDCYLNLIKYYKHYNYLPSLAYFDQELFELSKQYVNCFIKLVSDFENGSYLTHEQKNLIKLGTIERVNGKKEIIFSPLHPLNVAYQIALYDRVGDEKIPEELLARLRPTNLLPYIYSEAKKIYKPFEQNHSPEWTYYVDYKVPRYNGSRNFVVRLVNDKIKEFVNHFSYLFSLSNYSPIKINLINMGDCKEVLQGIFDYYERMLKTNIRPESLLPIELIIYQEKDCFENVFEDFSFYNDVKSIKEKFDLKLSSDKYSEEDILNYFREKVRFYVKDNAVTSYEYSHITFYQMERFITETYSDMNDLYSGVSLEGFISGVPSAYAGDSYRTGFGTKFCVSNRTNLLELSTRLNSLARIARNLDPYSHKDTIITAVSDNVKRDLDKIYNCSHWVTFIEPQVDLNFFKNDEDAKDLLIIHYSDQYSSSSGYDAITVTRRSRQYQVIIDSFLREKGVKEDEYNSSKIINFFNAVNGDWLLSLIANNSHFPREKLSILSAIKTSLAYFSHHDIIWIPISLEEILRISGGVGLKRSDGLFSTKNFNLKGNYCDDLLLIGIEIASEDLKVIFYPLEVKIGNNDNGVLNKAINQVKQTSTLFEEHLTGESFLSALYRNFLMQIAIISAEKFKLYNIWPEQKWEQVTETNVRTKLLNDDYKISNNLVKYIGKGGVLSFKKSVHFRNVQMKEDVLLLEFTEQDGYNYIIKDVEDLRNQMISGGSDLSTEYLLFNKSLSEKDNNFRNSPGKEKLEDQILNEVASTQEEPDIQSDKLLAILFGEEKETNEQILWHPTSTDKVMHTNTGIIGTMGTGKTQFTKSIITQLHRNYKDNVNGTPIGILIFDYKGDYIKDDFVQATDAKVYNLYHLPYNPLTLFVNDNPKPLLPLFTANTLKETISTAFGLGVKQDSLLRDVIMDAYQSKGITKNDANSWKNTAPTISDVYQTYIEREDLKEDSLYAALTNLNEFEIFEPDADKTKSLFDIIDGVTVINLSGYDEGIQNLVVAITLDLFYSQMQLKGHSTIQGNFREITRMILVDEADNFLSKDFKALKKILKEGREFGVGTILSTQLLSHFSTSDNDYANYILTWIVHNVSDVTVKDIKYIFNTQSKGEEENIQNKIKKLEKHYSIVKLGGVDRPILIRDKAFWELASRGK